MPDIKELTSRIVKFNKERDWDQFHNPKDVALSLVLEAAEVMEHFQWKSTEESEVYLNDFKEDVGDELADVLYWVLLMSHDLDIDIKKAFERKMKINEKKYPIEKARGRKNKYNKL